MNRNYVLWGGILIIIGIAVLLGNVLHFNVWNLLWPILLIAVGLWIIGGIAVGQRPIQTEQAAIPLEGAGRARVHVRHGAGRLTIGSGTGADQLVAGSFAGGLEFQAHHEGDLLDVDMRVRERAAMFWPWALGPRGMEWTLNLNGNIPLSLGVESGASEMRLDLTELLLTDLSVKSGASSTQVTLPAHAGFTRVVVSSGAASVSVTVPAGVAAQIQARAAIADIRVDKNRFPRTDSGYRSADYDTAANKVEIVVETAVGAIEVR